MFCRNCGAQLPDDAKFCGTCGNLVAAAPVQKPTQQSSLDPQGAVNQQRAAAQQRVAAQQGAQAQQHVQMPPKPVKPVTPAPKKAKKTGLVIGGIAAGVAVIALVLVLVLTLFGGDAAKVAKAAAKTVGAYSEAVEKLNLPDVTELVEKGEYSQEVSVWLENMEYYEGISGFGARVTMDVNTNDKVIGMNMVPYFGSADIVDLKVKVENEQLYIGSEDLTGGKFYSVNTETFGQDLVDMGLEAEDVEDLGFNFFTVIEQMKELQTENEEATKILTDAAKALAKEIEVEKTGKETVDVNDNDVKCTVYHVMIPEDALSDYMGAVEDAYDEMDTVGGYLDILESMGIPDYVLEDMEYEMDTTDELFDAVDRLLEELGDLELDVYISGGYIMSVYYEGEYEGTDMEITLDLGGGKNYVDDLSFEMVTEYGEMVLVSNGDHSCADGEFTDKTTLDMELDGEEFNVLTSKMTYDPSAEDDNLSWTFSTEDVAFQMEGTLTAGKDSAYIRLDKISIFEYDDEVVCIGVEYKIDAYAGDNISIGSAVALPGMTEDELTAEAEEISEYAMDWAERVENDFPELIDALG